MSEDDLFEAVQEFEGKRILEHEISYIAREGQFLLNTRFIERLNGQVWRWATLIEEQLRILTFSENGGLGEFYNVASCSDLWEQRFSWQYFFEHNQS